MITVQDVAKTLRNSFMTVGLTFYKMYFTEVFAKIGIQEETFEVCMMKSYYSQKYE